MFEVHFYEDRHNRSQISEYIEEPHVKHIDGEIWELRPGDDRVLFAAWIENKFILLLATT